MPDALRFKWRGDRSVPAPTPSRPGGFLRRFLVKPLAIDHEGALYSIDTGERVPPTEAGRYRVLHITSVRSHVVRDRPAGRFPYLYRTGDGRYMMASTLTLPFLRDAIADRYQTSAVLLTAPAVAIACLGHRFEVVHLPKNPDEAREALERFTANFYQGVRYVSVPLEKAVALVQPRSKKPLLAAAVAGLMLCLSFLLGGGNEESPSLPPPPPPGTTSTARQTVNPHIVAMCRSRAIVLRAFREGLRAQRDMGFLGDIAFDGNGRVSLYYPLPLSNTKRVNDFYVRTLPVAPASSAACPPPRLTPHECLKRLAPFRPEIEGQSATGFVLRFARTETIERVAKLLATLAECPAEIHGHVVYRDPFRRDLALSVTVFSSSFSSPTSQPL